MKTQPKAPISFDESSDTHAYFGMPEFQQASSVRLLPLAYDTTFSNNGKLHLPYNGVQPGWADCFCPSTIKKGHYYIAYHEVLDPENMEKSHLARIARITTTGEIDTTFGHNNTGYIDIPFTSKGLSVFIGLHETQTGHLYIWGEAVNFNGGFIETLPCILKRLPNGAPDPGFGQNGFLDLNTLELPSPQDHLYYFRKPCCISPNGSLFAGVHYADGNIHYVLKITPAGTLDATFNGTGILPLKNPTSETDDLISAYLLLSALDEGFYVGGDITNNRTDFRNAGYVMKINANGQPDKHFGRNGLAKISSEEFNYKLGDISIDIAHNKIAIAGGTEFLEPITSPYFDIGVAAKLTMDGTPDNNFNAGKPQVYRFEKYNTHLSACTFQQKTEEKMFVFGSTTSNTDAMGRLHSDGSVDGGLVGNNAFGTPVDFRFASNRGAFYVQPQASQILVGGYGPVVAAFKV